jgi:hypothetical protein
VRAEGEFSDDDDPGGLHPARQVIEISGSVLGSFQAAAREPEDVDRLFLRPAGNAPEEGVPIPTAKFRRKNGDRCHLAVYAFSKMEDGQNARNPILQ